MFAQCNQQSFGFHPLGRRNVVANFDGGRISSDAGGLLLRETERITASILGRPRLPRDFHRQ